MALSSYTQMFLKEEPEGREVFLQNLTAAQREIVYQEWAEHPELTISDLLDQGLPESHFFEMERELNRNHRDREFYVAPDPSYTRPDWLDKDPEIKIELPMRRGVRRFRSIDRPTKVSGEAAINFLANYGPNGKWKHKRGMLKEISEEEYIEHLTQRQAEIKAAKAKEAKAAKKGKG